MRLWSENEGRHLTDDEVALYLEALAVAILDVVERSTKDLTTWKIAAELERMIGERPDETIINAIISSLVTNGVLDGFELDPISPN